jgi:hypothetical protein
MSAVGHIKLHRALLQHALTLQLPAAWFRIWIVILMRASWQGSTWWDGAQEIPVPRGSFVTSFEKLAKATGASQKQVRSAIQYFERAGMVTRTVTYRHSLVSVTNWALYQDKPEVEGKLEGKPEGIVRATSGQPEGNSIRSIRNIRKEIPATEESIPANAKLPDWGT